MKIVFMGTPDFAVSTLDALIEAGHDICGVITSTDKYGGRNKKKLIESDVKVFGKEKGLNILQPKNLKSSDFISELRDLKADLFIIVAFRMLPEVVWSMPPKGTFNLHGSLLPKYRGAAPIHWAVINGEKKTGVTSFFLKHEIDTGDIILQKEIEIGAKETTGSLYNRMKNLGAEVVIETVKRIENGEVDLKMQDSVKATPAPKLNKENTVIDFDKSGLEIFNLVRGLNPFPVAWFNHDEHRIKVYDIEFIKTKHNKGNGEVDTDNKKYVHFYVKDGYISLLDIQVQGKKRMLIKDLLNGFKF